MSGHRKKSTKQGALTFWRRQREGLVRTRKETDRASSTHFLETTEGGTCQDTKKNRASDARDAHSQTGDSRGRDLSGHGKKRPSEGHSLPGDGRGRDLSGNRKKITEQGALTSWRQQRERLCQDTERNRPTDQGALTSWIRQREGGTCQSEDMERNRPTEGHSLSGDSRRRDLSGHGKRLTEQGALTLWRRQREGLIRTQKETY